MNITILKSITICIIILLINTGCSTKHLSVDKDREVHLSAKESNVLYEYAKDDIESHAPMSGYYPLANHLDSLSARVILAKVATKSIKFQYFTFHGDESGSLLMYSVLEAADRGVTVEILIDDIELNKFDKVLASINDHPNITFRTFNPTNTRASLHYVEIGLNSDTLGRRMHNKAFIVDNSMAVFGGRNIGDIYFGQNIKNYFIDNDILVVGPFVNELTNQFEHYFSSRFSVDFENIYKASIKDIKKERDIYNELLNSQEYKHFFEVVSKRSFVKKFRAKELPLYFASAELYYDMPEKIATDPKDRTYHIEGSVDNKYMPEKSLVVVNPYFIPNEEMIKIFKDLRNKGVEISILTNSLESTDGKAVYAYYSEYQEELLKMGVKLFETHPHALKSELLAQAYNTEKVLPKTGLHAKTIIIDGKKP
jgi:putative cardiolipin synthase